jgi:hypothetical protein
MHRQLTEALLLQLYLLLLSSPLPAHLVRAQFLKDSLRLQCIECGSVQGGVAEAIMRP